MTIIIALAAVAFVPERAVDEARLNPTSLAVYYGALVAQMNLTS